MDGAGAARRPGEVVRSWRKVCGRGAGDTGALGAVWPGGRGSPAKLSRGCAGAARRGPCLVRVRIGAGVSVSPAPAAAGPAAGCAALPREWRRGSRTGGGCCPGCGERRWHRGSGRRCGELLIGAGRERPRARGGFPGGFWQRPGGSHVPWPDGAAPWAGGAEAAGVLMPLGISAVFQGTGSLRVWGGVRLWEMVPGSSPTWMSSSQNRSFHQQIAAAGARGRQERRHREGWGCPRGPSGSRAGRGSCRSRSLAPAPGTRRERPRAALSSPSPRAHENPNSIGGFFAHCPCAPLWVRSSGTLNGLAGRGELHFAFSFSAPSIHGA